MRQDIFVKDVDVKIPFNWYSSEKMKNHLMFLRHESGTIRHLSFFDREINLYSIGYEIKKKYLNCERYFRCETKLR